MHRPASAAHHLRMSTHSIESVLPDITFRRAPMPGQHVAETEAGTAVITRVRDEGPRGGAVWSYEIETSFKPSRTRLHYGYASYAAARRGVAQLVASHLNEAGS